jgi:uncharacterized protein YigE (DUF2233 family)
VALLLAAILWTARGDKGGGAQPVAPAASGPCEQRRFEGSVFIACRYDRRRHELALVLDEGGTPLRTLARLEAHLGPRAGRLLFAMNAGMYDDRGMPIGLYVERSRERHPVVLRAGPGNFGMKPNGVMAVGADGKLAIMTSEDWARSGRKARWATQSGPMLVIGGRLHPAIQPNGSSLYVRNAVGAVPGGDGWFVISEEPVSFGRLARFLRDGLGCRDALYFDGAVSSLWAPSLGRRDGGFLLGPMVAVLARP